MSANIIAAELTLNLNEIKGVTATQNGDQYSASITADLDNRTIIQISIDAQSAFSNPTTQQTTAISQREYISLKVKAIGTTGHTSIPTREYTLLIQALIKTGTNWHLSLTPSFEHLHDAYPILAYRPDYGFSPLGLLP